MNTIEKMVKKTKNSPFLFFCFLSCLTWFSILQAGPNKNSSRWQTLFLSTSLTLTCGCQTSTHFAPPEFDPFPYQDQSRSCLGSQMAELSRNAFDESILKPLREEAHIALSTVGNMKCEITLQKGVAKFDLERKVLVETHSDSFCSFVNASPFDFELEATITLAKDRKTGKTIVLNADVRKSGSNHGNDNFSRACGEIIHSKYRAVEENLEERLAKAMLESLNSPVYKDDFEDFISQIQFVH